MRSRFSKSRSKQHKFPLYNREPLLQREAWKCVNGAKSWCTMRKARRGSLMISTRALYKRGGSFTRSNSTSVIRRVVVKETNWQHLDTLWATSHLWNWPTMAVAGGSVSPLETYLGLHKVALGVLGWSSGSCFYILKGESKALDSRVSID